MSERSITNTATATATVRSVSALGLIWVLLIGAKLFEVPALAGWSWWIIILFPVWSVIAIVVAFVIVAAAIVVIYFGSLFVYSKFASARLRRTLAKTIERK